MMDSMPDGSAGTGRERAPAGDDCLLIIFGATGDLTKRLLVPSLYNLACDGLLSRRCLVIGVARDALSRDVFRKRLGDDILRYTTRTAFDHRVWEDFASRLHYVRGSFEDPE